ncbi:hypothetical protein BVY01_01185, partial [bacterium I07]
FILLTAGFDEIFRYGFNISKTITCSLEKLGEGGMGVVYKAHDTKLDRIVALKFLSHDTTISETDRARFLQEAKAASAINHANVCTIYDIKEEDGKQFIVMEYVEGETLGKKLKNGALEYKTAIDYAIQIAEALQAAHEKGIIHRDIKSENIMVTPKNQIKVMDFGLAKLRGSLKLTKTSSTLGTVSYMSPEQILGKEVDARSDIFSFGVVLYEMLSGQLPFKGEYEAAVTYAIVNEEPEPLHIVKSIYSSGIKHLLDKLLVKDPNNRYQSVLELIPVLELLYSRKDSLIESPKSSSNKASNWLSKKSTIPILITLGFSLFLIVVLKIFNPFGLTKPPSLLPDAEFIRHTFEDSYEVGRISPNGKYLAYVEEMKLLIIKDLVTEEKREVSIPDAKIIYEPVWSPSGDEFGVYYHDAELDTGVFAIH